MGLLLALYLQTMLHTAEKPVCFVKRQHFVARKKIQLTEGSQGLEHARFLQECIVRSMDKLQCLHYELDFANTTAAEFDIARERVRANDVALDARLEVRELIRGISRSAPWRTEGWMLQSACVGRPT